MFVFERKEFLGWTIKYQWKIVYNDSIIGTMNLILRPGELELCGVSAIAYFYREKMHNVTEDDITQIARDFVSLAKNRLLDVDEAYGNLYIVEKKYYDDDALDRFRYYI